MKYHCGSDTLASFHALILNIFEEVLLTPAQVRARRAQSSTTFALVFPRELKVSHDTVIFVSIFGSILSEIHRGLRNNGVVDVSIDCNEVVDVENRAAYPLCLSALSGLEGVRHEVSTRLVSRGKLAELVVGASDQHCFLRAWASRADSQCIQWKNCANGLYDVSKAHCLVLRQALYAH